MDLFRLGLRNLMGVLLPGALLVLVFIYAVFVGANAAGWQIDPSLLDHWSTAVIAFLISYLFGSLMRFFSADDVDSMWREHRSEEIGLLNPEQLNQKWEATATESGISEDDLKSPEALDVIWTSDQFPYPVWYFYKLRLFHVPDAYEFFLKYRRCMRNFEAPGKLGKEFFNYCKLAVFLSSKSMGDSLEIEIQGAEGLVRFYAGTYYALEFGWKVLFGLGLWQVLALAGAVTKIWTGPEFQSRSFWAHVFLIMFSAVLVWAARWTKQKVVKSYRRMRMKEADTVYDAFYLVHLNGGVQSEFSSPASRPAVS